MTMHWLRHATLTWVERSFSCAGAREYAGHREEVAAALSVMTSEPHPLGARPPDEHTRVLRALTISHKGTSSMPDAFIDSPHGSVHTRQPVLLRAHAGARGTHVVATAMTAFIAIGAFWLSFTALRSLAITAGIPHGEAWLWPLIIEGSMTQPTVHCWHRSIFNTVSFVN